MKIRKLVIVAAASTLVIAACGDAGGATDAVAATTTLPSAASATTTSAPPTPTTTTTTASATTTVASTTTTTFAKDLTSLRSALGGVSGDGWLVPAGTYGSDHLSVPVRYELTAEASVDIWDVGVTFGPVGFGYQTHPVVIVAEFAGLPVEDEINAHIHSENPTVVPIGENGDITSFLSETPGLVLLDSDATARAASWDFTVDATEGDGFRCPRGDNCFNIVAVTGHGFFTLGEDWTVRLWRIESAAGPVYAWLQAPNDDFQDGVAFGLPIVERMTVG